MSQRILLVEDEKNIGSTLTDYLQDHGFECVWAETINGAISELESNSFQLAILDVGLPDGSGFDLAKGIQDKYPSIGLLFLTAYTHPDDRIKGLSLGAEDYVMKPFNMTELLLRIKNALKRSDYRQELSKRAVTIGKAVFDFSTLTVQGQEDCKLTKKEWDLLRFLFERANKVVSRDEILNHVWGADEFPTTRTVDNFILRLRKTIEEAPEMPSIILSMRGIGYKLVYHE